MPGRGSLNPPAIGLVKPMPNTTRTATINKTGDSSSTPAPKSGARQAPSKTPHVVKALSPAKAAPSEKAEKIVPMDYDTFLTKMGPRDKLNIERHITACEAEPDPAHANLWKRIACYLMTLAPHAPKTTGQQAVSFFIPDGKYRMQVFALQDLSDEKIVIYVSTTLDDILKANIVTGPRLSPEKGIAYPIADSRETLNIEELDGKSADPSPFYKDMLGWNRKAVRLTLMTTATPTQAGAVEKVVANAARKWK